jgi:hypothetical protein
MRIKDGFVYNDNDIIIGTTQIEDIRDGSLICYVPFTGEEKLQFKKENDFNRFEIMDMD